MPHIQHWQRHQLVCRYLVYRCTNLHVQSIL
jgi:hypothetical protein